MLLVVDGIILVLSCHKHMNTRLKEFNLNNEEYNGWKVIYVIGDLFLKDNFEIRNNNYLYIKCEDSYLHLLKKLILAIKYIYTLFDIKHGILRCGDDLIFNEKLLTDFLMEDTKPDYWGDSCPRQNCIVSNLNEEQKNNILKNAEHTNWMVDYYKGHKNDFENELHGLKDINISDYTLKPKIFGAIGTLFYISNKSCKILVEHMEKINFNILQQDNLSGSYPYVIEDVGVAFILYNNYVDYIEKGNFCGTLNPIAKHTNKFK